MPATSAAARSRGKARRVSRAVPAARTVQAVGRRRAAPLSPRRGPGRGAAVWGDAGSSWNQACQQKQKAQLTRAWWRRIAVSERTWKSAQPRSEERRVGKECRSRWSPDHQKTKKSTNQKAKI